MSALRDDGPIEWELVDPTEPGLTVDEAYALLAGIDGSTSELRPPRVAAGAPRRVPAHLIVRKTTT